LQNVASIDELNRFFREQAAPDVLCAKETDLSGGRDLSVDAVAFPESIQFGGQPVPVSYAYAPGEEWDGVTLRLPLEVATAVTSAAVDWAIPSLRAEMVGELLASLPKTHRRVLQPFAPKVEEIVRDLSPVGPTLLHDLSRFLKDRYAVAVGVGDWRPDNLPAHLRPRVEVVGGDRKKPVAVGRDLASIRETLAQVKSKPVEDTGAWRRAAEQWERPGVTQWTFGDLPDQVPLGEAHGLPMSGWLGLKTEDNAVSVRLFRTAEAARAASLPGLQRLVELALSRELGWLERDLRGLQKLVPAYGLLGSGEELLETAFGLVKRHVLPDRTLPSLRESLFRARVEESRARIPGLAQQLIDRMAGVLEVYGQVRRKIGAPAGAVAGAGPSKSGAAGAAKSALKTLSLKDFSQLDAVVARPAPPASGPAVGAGGSVSAGTSTPAEELLHLMGPRFLERTSYERLPHLMRYLKALLVRVERAALNPAKDRERAALLVPYLAALKKVEATRDFSEEGRVAAEEFRWLVEEYKVSLFAQELGTAVPVSPKRLDAVWERVRLECR
jgi:ATP-dependent helicase HrpA